MDIEELCNGLVYSQRQRVFCIKSQSRCDRSIEAFIATLLGFQAPKTKEDSPEERKRAMAARKKLFNLAATIRTRIEKAGPNFEYKEHGDQIAGIAPMILRSAEARAGWDVHRSEIEEKMRDVAQQLPAWPFVETIKGFGDLGLAVIVGEAGNLSNYSSAAKLWKRFGLAVDDGGYRQGRLPPNLSREDRAAAWTERGYVPRRRAETYAFIDDVMFRQQWRAARDAEGNAVKGDDPPAVPAHAIGPYGEMYGRKKAEYLERAFPAGHADKAARRYMTKCFMVDLWRGWKAGSAVAIPINRALFYEGVAAADLGNTEIHRPRVGGGDATVRDAVG